MKKILIIIISVLLLIVLLLLAYRLISGGGETPPTTEPPGQSGSIEGVKWQLESLGDKDSPTPVVAGSDVTAEFNKTDGQVTGSAGCNNYFGGYELDGDKLTIGPLGSTQMFCDGLMDQEQAYLMTLQSAEKFEATADKLTIFAADNQVLNYGKGETAEQLIAVINGPTAGTVGQPLTFDASQSTGPISMMTWRFDDGSPEIVDQMQVTHVFQKPGMHRITLDLQSAQMGVEPVSTFIDVNITETPAPETVKAVLTGPTSGTVGQSLSFSAEGSTGPIAMSLWDFGDGSTVSDQPVVSHSYSETGTYRVVLTVQGEHVGSGSDSTYMDVTINAASGGEKLVAVVNGPTNGEVGQPLTFNSTGSSGPISTNRWDFSDGTTVNDQPEVTHTFSTPGLHRVTLTLQSAQMGIDSASAFIDVNITEASGGEKLIAVINGPNTGEVGATLSFDSYGSSGPISKQIWAFDNTTIIEDLPQVSHIFQTPGTHRVTLTLQSSQMGVESVSTYLDVNITQSSSGEKLVAVINGPVSGAVGESLVFSSFGSTGPISTQTWSFDDNTVVQDEPVVSHVFNEPGTRRVTLTLQSAQMGVEATSTFHDVTITATSPPGGTEPVKAVIDGPAAGGVGQPLTFVSQSTGPIAVLLWDFGDGTFARNQSTVTHVYNTPGIYDVRLGVQGEHAGSGVDVATLQVIVGGDGPTTLPTTN